MTNEKSYIFKSIDDVMKSLEEEERNRTWLQKAWKWCRVYIIVNIWDNIRPRSIYNRVKHFLQKLFRGYNDVDLWDLDNTLTRFILPRLKAFRQTSNKGIPTGFETKSYDEVSKMNDEESDKYFESQVIAWNNTLDKMITAFELMKKDEWKSVDDLKEQEKVIDEGLALFAKYYRGLWW